MQRKDLIPCKIRPAPKKDAKASTEALLRTLAKRLNEVETQTIQKGEAGHPSVQRMAVLSLLFVKDVKQEKSPG